MPHKFVRPFHFWCQKVLPLVFDDSLSYYEVLAKMRDYLNSAIEEISSIGGEFEGVKTQLTQLKTYVDEYFEKLDVNQAISDKLDDMVETGEMDAVITPIFAAYANPLFAASVADMIATNFAYANYENNKIYAFNQSTGLYQTTGKEFGGVVSSVDEMEDRDKYYALDSDGMLYSYDFPESAFVATGLTYGGYRYGVNAMRPIANVYVLTTDSHVYTWNGSEYVDSGVVYGLNNTAFVWRRELSRTDNVTLLITDGWYCFKQESLPNGLPVDMKVSDGFVVVYSIPNTTEVSENLQDESQRNIQNQRSQTIRTDSRNKRIILKTTAGGSWFWNGETWVSDNEIGFVVCNNANNISYNSTVICNNCYDTPIEHGLLKTFVAGDDKSQLFWFDNRMWFRTNINPWIEIPDKSEYLSTLKRVEIVVNEIASNYYSLTEYYASVFEAINDNYNTLITSLTMQKYVPLSAENNNFITTENSNALNVEKRVPLTDSTLTDDDLPANAGATGTSIRNVNDKINEVERRITDNQYIADTFNTTFSKITTIVGAGLLAQNSDVICAQNGSAILYEYIAIKTDSTLTDNTLPANSKATGEAIRRIAEQITPSNYLGAVSNYTKQDYYRQQVAFPEYSQFPYVAFSSGVVANNKEIHVSRIAKGHLSPYDDSNRGIVGFHIISPNHEIYTFYPDIDYSQFYGELRDPNLSVNNDNTRIFLSGFSTKRGSPDTYSNYLIVLDNDLNVLSQTEQIQDPVENYRFWGNILQTPTGYLLKSAYSTTAGSVIYRSTAPYSDGSTTTFEIVHNFNSYNTEMSLCYYHDKIIGLSRSGKLNYTTNLEGTDGWTVIANSLASDAVCLPQKSNDPLIVCLGSKYGTNGRAPAFHIVDPDTGQVLLTRIIDDSASAGGYPSMIRLDNNLISTIYYSETGGCKLYHQQFDIRFIPGASALLSPYTPCVYPTA